MGKYQRIICIWICYISCLFRHTQLPTVAAVPFEYFDDHEQLSYDLDTEQSKAKYDTRLLSEQLLKGSSKSLESYDVPPDEDREGMVELEGADDLQPHERAAPCFNAGRKYTHGQKVPRQDACEVCLCMDGEIFCWWEKCAKKPTKIKTEMDYTSSRQEQSTRKSQHMRILATTTKTTHTTVKPKRKQQQQQQQQHEYDAMQKATQISNEQQQHNKKHAGKSLRKKLYQPAQRKHAQRLVATTEQQPQPQQQSQQQHAHKHEYSHSAGSSKILNFPENLPSVLYYDYKTEEHQHHQHEHHQQHLKHQQQQQQRILLQRQQQQLLEQAAAAATAAQEAQPRASERSSYTETSAAPAESTGNDNVYDELETDSDILPEPPTKRPKVTVTTTRRASTAQTAGATGAVAGVAAAAATTQEPANPYSNNNNNYNEDATNANNVLYDAHANPLSDSDSETDSNTEATTTSAHQSNNENSNKNKYDDEDEDQDDAFHRWLSSTDSSNNNKHSYPYNSSKGDSNFDAIQNSYLPDAAAAQNMTTGNADISSVASSNGSSKVTYTQQEQQQPNAMQIAGNAFLRSSFNDYSSEFNGSVVNIDILLTAANGNQQQQQQRQKSQQQQQQYIEQIDKQSLILPGDLITNTNKMKTATETTVTATATMPGVNSSNSNISATPKAAVHKLNAPTAPIAALPQQTTTLSPDRQCNVMGTLYKIGEVLPQDTGNCLQCVCIDGSTSDDTPRVTCSPHNCPPLVLPDLFDATGY